MFFSEPVEFKFRGHPALLSVFRHDGHRWGRVVSRGDDIDITVGANLYDETDSAAAETLIRAIGAEAASVEPALGWIGLLQAQDHHSLSPAR